jgi:hypothetical protein
VYSDMEGTVAFPPDHPAAAGGDVLLRFIISHILKQRSSAVVD